MLILAHKPLAEIGMRWHISRWEIGMRFLLTLVKKTAKIAVFF